MHTTGLPPDPVDRHVGARVRARRLAQKKTQTALARVLGVSFRQMQKYESAHAHMTAATLFIIARVLDVCPDYFYADFEPPEHAADTPSQPLVLADAFASVQTPRCRRQMVALVRSFGERQV
ncbi:MAG: helix-turn-helix transcriptional regulator [Asticcacaulis sp.]